MEFPADVRLGVLSCNDLALVITGTCCLGWGDCLLLSTADDPVDSGVRIRGCCLEGGCGVFGLATRFCTGDARIDLLTEDDTRDITDTGDEDVLIPAGGTAFMLSTFFTAICGLARVVMLLALSMMSLD